MKVVVLFFAFAMVVNLNGFSQNEGKYGTSEDLCLRNYSLYKGYLKNDIYTDAKLFWDEMIKICPRYSTGIWADGEKIYKTAIESTGDPVAKVRLADSLLWIFDRRIEYFGDNPRFSKGYILGRKGLFILESGFQPVETGYKILMESVDLQKEESNAAVLLSLMQASQHLFSTGIINAREVLNNYDTCMAIVQANLARDPGEQNYKIAGDGIEQYLLRSGAAGCSTLVGLFSGQFKDNEGSSDWLNKTLDILKSAGCTETELYLKSSEALFAIEPSAESAHKLANFHYLRENYVRAAEYLEKGVAMDGDSEEKAAMLYELAIINYSQLKEYTTARNYAIRAIELRPNWGDPYILVGKLYIDGRQSVSNDPFEQSAVFWAAVDKFIQAKKADPEQGQRANELINQYSQYFPNNEDVFMQTFRDGDKYLVGGWINEQTTVRSRKL